MAKKVKNIEEQLKRLEEIQTTLEAGTAPIEDMLKLYEEGMSLVNDARYFLEQAQQKVTEISNKKGEVDDESDD